MYGTGTKKMLNILILNILKDYSDSEHRLQQQNIIDLLDSNYGISCERRAIKNNIVSLFMKAIGSQLQRVLIIWESTGLR